MLQCNSASPQASALPSALAMQRGPVCGTVARRNVTTSLNYGFRALGLRAGLCPGNAFVADSFVGSAEQ
jgi:hypothetical protein